MFNIPTLFQLLHIHTQINKIIGVYILLIKKKAKKNYKGWTILIDYGKKLFKKKE